MRIRARFIVTVICLVVVLLGIGASAYASWSWCTGGCPPGLSDNDKARAFEATAGNEHVDLHLVDPTVGNTVVTSNTPAAEHNPNFKDLQP